MEELLEKHRKEKKDLKTKTQSIKKKVPKGDKKREKEAKKEIQQLEESLKEKHESELKSLQAAEGEAAVAEMQGLKIERQKSESSESSEKPVKMSKAQRRRRNKEEKAREREREIVEAEKNQELSLKTKERVSIFQQLGEMGLKIKEMKPDGNCLYHAFVDQEGGDVGHARVKVANHLRQNKEDYKFFLVDNSTGDCFSDTQYESYCKQTEADGTWGGQLELQALSKIFKVHIVVIQGDGNNVEIGEEYKKEEPSVILTYHRHELSLGEHYNSVEKIES